MLQTCYKIGDRVQIISGSVHERKEDRNVCVVVPFLRADYKLVATVLVQTRALLQC